MNLNLLAELDVAIVNEEQKGVHGLVDSILGLLSATKFSEMYANKVKTDEHFAKFNNNLFSAEFKIIWNNLYVSCRSSPSTRLRHVPEFSKGSIRAYFTFFSFKQLLKCARVCESWKSTWK